MVRQYGAPKDIPGNPNDRGYGAKERKDPEPQAKDSDPSPESRIVEAFHKNASVDRRREDIHHTVGSGPAQASPGDHRHDGGDSVALLEGYTIIGTKTVGSVDASIIECLVRLGAKDSST